MDWTALALSLRLAACTTVLLLLLGVPLAHWLAFSTRRWKVLVEAIVALPLVLPPTVLGFYLLLATAPDSPLGRFLEAGFGLRLPFTFAGLLVASVLYSLPFAVQPFTVAFQSVDRNLLEAAWTLGASKSDTFRRVVAPLAWPGLVAGAVLSFAHTLGEFGVVLMMGGNLPGATRTLSIAIYDDVQAFDYGRAGKTSLFLLGFSFVVLLVTYGLRARKGSPWRLG